jgi:hypothetical protein
MAFSFFTAMDFSVVTTVFESICDACCGAKQVLHPVNVAARAMVK